MDRFRFFSLIALMALLVIPGSANGQALDNWVNWESPPVHPIDLVVAADLLLVANTADGYLEVYDVASGTPESLMSIPVGLDPVSVRARSATEAWVVNRISDSISIVNLIDGTVRWTLNVEDEPADVIFAGTPEKAYVSCSGTDTILVFDPENLTVAPTRIDIVGEEPRALATSPDGSAVYCAIFESGNGTTVMSGGFDLNAPGGGNGVIAFPPNVVNDPAGPYAGVNPPPNNGSAFEPPLNPAVGTPPPVALIVQKFDEDVWLDDNGVDWGPLVSGAQANLSGRPVGWDLADHDVAVIDTSDDSVTYIKTLMNICMGIAVRPSDGAISVIGTDAHNVIRFEPNLEGHFIDVLHALIPPAGGSVPAIENMNPHLPAGVGNIPPAQRVLSMGDPRAIVWSSDGEQAYVAGKGSGNVIQINPDGTRDQSVPPFDVGAGATGLALDEVRNVLYVLEHFDAAVSVIDLQSGTVGGRVNFHDPTTPEVVEGRKFLYDTHLTSGMGQVSCASCHVDARTDRLSWDLGDPSGVIEPFNDFCNMALPIPGAPDCDDFHPMKGPMLTQTMQDIIGKEPHHWRGDRFGIEAFGGAFISINADDGPLVGADMQAFEGYLASIHFPPNPFRTLTNSLPTDLSLEGHYTTGRFAPEGLPLGPGNAVTGLEAYRDAAIGLDGGLQCVSCHTLPIGIGPNSFLSVGFVMEEIPDGPFGEKHHGMVSVDGSTQRNIKIPQLRNLYKRTGFNMTQQMNTSGFGFLHDGSVDTIERFLAEPAFDVVSDQQIADLTAFMLAFSGSDLPEGNNGNPLEPLGTLSLDSHAAVGKQITLNETNRTNPQLLSLIETVRSEAALGRIGLIAKSRRAGVMRGWVYVGSVDLMQSDVVGDASTLNDLIATAVTGEELTLTAVPTNCTVRMGIDRDADGFFDGMERLACSDPADPQSIPGSCSGIFFIRGDSNGDTSLDISDAVTTLEILFGSGAGTSCEDALDTNDDGVINIADPVRLLDYLFASGPVPPLPGDQCGEDETADTLLCLESVCP